MDVFVLAEMDGIITTATLVRCNTTRLKTAPLAQTTLKESFLFAEASAPSRTTVLEMPTPFLETSRRDAFAFAKMLGNNLTARTALRRSNRTQTVLSALMEWRDFLTAVDPAM